ncbi:hypothetical protein HL658_04095 [Azospirillum sp. RWY-5-1]|uniref:Uncharacterized protein n=1 Tax=Azospirillum oleiclasticum TaxID=2735135 RepID=A0ABX2T3K8_9PROT|nr:hypothetical protein [Azospirillum oleiclasticum]NYZ11720.1 hypothetical protein [Azospirillum oleiclasticum]NYZ18881.1 hypothetical protein [Azospirillum oleiclasticum]
MVISGEFLGMLLLVTSAAALGLSIVIDVGRISAERARLTMLQRQFDKKRAAHREWNAKADQKAVELKAHHTRLLEFTSRKQKVQQEIKALEFVRVELVHELGDPAPGAMGFWAQLQVMPNFATVDRHEVVFSRQIWEYRNVAHVWAGASEHAQALLRIAFTQRSGVQATRMLPLVFAPDGVEADSGAYTGMETGA